MSSVPQKRCGKCGEAKPRTDFYAHYSTADRLRPDCKDCVRQGNRDRYAANIEDRRRYGRDYRAANLAERQGYERQWRRDNLDAVLAQGHVKRARKRDALCGCVTAEHVAILYAQTCAYCDATPATDIDHIMPLSRGGLHCLSNLAPACEPCNQTKHAKIIDNPPAPMFACTRGAC